MLATVNSNKMGAGWVSSKWLDTHLCITSGGEETINEKYPISGEWEEALSETYLMIPKKNKYYQYERIMQQTAKLHD